MDFWNDFSREYVGSGDFIVQKRQPKVLEAILGTCVAVTLCDHAAGVGGMIHLLLWEPFGDGALVSPASYASTGLPLLIQAMIDAGAEKNRMMAGIVGGALIGPVSMTDRNLDVGGRTAETVDRILWLKGIPVKISETGGYEGRRALLNLKSFETLIAPSLKISGRGATDFTKPDSEEIKAAIKNVRPIPQIALKIIRMLSEGDYGWLDVSGEVRRDQVILAKVLHLCNVASLGLRTKVDSIERGVILLGEKKLMQIVMSAAFEDYYSQAEQGYSLTRGG
ncbi:MAG: HDOD domain-containing protein, partial [Thermodesulfobacteriota bacterium]|nr:HDOD domain-containing protein [Thermodesulfobacteriota bacterium]